MKKLRKESVKRIIKALQFALRSVRSGENLGLCLGIFRARYNQKVRGLTDTEYEYLTNWIRSMLGDNYYLEDYMNLQMQRNWAEREQRYQLRKPWVEWMINHLKETT